MNSTATSHAERSVEVVGLNLRLLEGGTGDPLLVVHHDTGNPGWTALHDALTGSFTVRVPDLPGYGGSDRADWARHARDLAITLQLLLDRLDIDRTALVGLGFGGWIAAEMATMSQRRFSSLVLVGAMGIRPPQGDEIMDQMMSSIDSYIQDGFSNRDKAGEVYGAEPSRELRAAWDQAREMTARVAWKPYMFSHQLPHLLAGVETPTLVVWGSDDRIVPLSCGRRFAEIMPNARLEVVEGAGHWIDMEQPQELAGLIAAHTGSR
jgi:pimeloyl-ACP methyl ester carboxylesterase